MKWIPMSERLPKNGHYYLWCSDMGSVQSDYYWDGFEKEQKYGYNIVAWMPLPRPYTADRKTENSSEIPNNSTISKMEQVDKDINVRSKTELKTQTETQNSNLTFEKADEPQTEKGGCTNCDGKDLCNNAFTEISQYCGAYEPQNGYQTFNGTSVYVSRLEDEPQSDCPWK